MDDQEEIILRPLSRIPDGKRRQLDENDILSSLSVEYFHNLKRIWDLMDLILFFVLVLIYYLLLWTQFDVKNSFKIKTSLQSILPQDPNGNQLPTFDSSDKVYDWINSSIVNNIWSEPICGNGICEPPAEIASGIFSNRGCDVDCGTVSKISIEFTVYGEDFLACNNRYNSLENSSCPWFDVKLNWIALDESERDIKSNAVRNPSGVNGSINYTSNYFEIPEDSTSTNPYAYVGLNFELNQGPYVKWYIDFPLIGSNVEVYVYFDDNQTGSFVQTQGFSQNFLNAFYVYTNDTDSKTYFLYDDKFDVIPNKNTSCIDVTREYNSTDVLSDTPDFIHFPIRRCVGPPKSHIQVNIINPISMYADYLSSTPRTLDSSQKFANRALIGALITLTRKQAQKKDCSINELKFNYSTSEYVPQFSNETLASISKWCQLFDDDNATQFGSSPLFNKNSSFYDKSFVQNSSKNSDNWFIVPNAFNDSISQGKDKHLFFFLLDVAFERKLVDKFVTYMKDGGFIDSLSDVLTVKILSFNSEFDLFSLLKVKISFSDHGSIDITNTINFLPAYRKKTTRVLSILYWIFLSIVLLIELLEFIYYVLKKKTIQFIWWNIFDIITYAFFLTSGILWLQIDHRLTRFRPLNHYDVYADTFPPNSLDISILSNDTSRYNGTLGYVKMFEQYKYFEDTLHMKIIYTTVTCINSIFLVLRLIKLFDFDSKFGIISRTITDIGSTMFNLGILWFVLSLGYAVAGVLAFGEQMLSFSDLNYALNTLGQVVMGDDTVNMLYETIYPDYSQRLPAHIYFWSYVFLSYVILINFVIAVTCYSFEGLYEYTRKKGQLKNPKSQNNILFLLKNPNLIKSYLYLFRILKNYTEEKFPLKSFKEITDSLERTQNAGDDLEGDNRYDYQKRASDLDSICDKKSVYIYGTEIDYEQLYAILKRKLSNELNIQGNKLEVEAYNIVHVIYCCFGKDKSKLMKKLKKEQKSEAKNMLLSEINSLKKEMAEIRSILATKSETNEVNQLPFIRSELSDLKKLLAANLK